MSSIDGLVTGLDTTAIIKQLMAIERRPQDALTTRKSQAEKARTELTGIRSDVNALGSLARNLRLATAWNPLRATSTNTTAVSLSARSAATTGAYTFRVTSLASAATVYSANTFASLDSPVGPTGDVFSASGHQSLGIASMTGTGFDPGDVAFEVLQTSTAAKLDSVVDIPAVPITIDGTNDGIDISVDGFSFSVQLANDTYTTKADLATAFNDAIQASGAAGKVTATLNDQDRIQLTTTGEGSAHSVGVTGGTGTADLGLSVGLTAFGTDGIVSVNGTATTVTDASAGAVVSLPSGGTGTISATLSGGLREGSAQVMQLSTGTGSLSDVVNAVNRSNLGYSATAVNTGNGYRLQLTAKTTGVASAFTPDAQLFGSTAFTTLSAGSDAEITITGANPYTVSSSTNTFSNLLPGVDVTVNALTDTAVTVSTEHDHDAVAAKVEELVKKLNDVNARIAKATANVPGADRSILQGSRETRRAAEALRGALVAPVDESSLSSVGVVGVELAKDGTINFDKAKFTEALKNNPAELTKLFTSGTANGGTGALDRMVAAVDSATKVGEGYLYTAAEANDKRIDDYGRQIDAYETRLTQREAALRRTYANLEVALSTLQKQSSNLAAQLGSIGR
ncbi:MAG: flagellar filament capping protein FliD [Acidimicrobiia bacterium]|nr:flagellar filament capping protein FliD [Acidimicrobiia bacterium]MDH4365608.1 flagellar filament capping protein FliD [Acidimicrobiia bacterium]